MRGSAEDYVRAHGSDFRKHLSGLFLANGPEMGLAIAKRMMWELADHVMETHGPTAVKDMLGEAQDAIQLDMAPVIDVQPDGPDPYVQALEGVITLSEQNRRTIAALVSATNGMAGLVARLLNDHGRAAS